MRKDLASSPDVTISTYSLLALGFALWVGLLANAGHLIFRALRHDEHGVGLAALTLVLWLDVLSFLTGFSIGWAVAIVNAILGVVLALLAKHYRLQVLFATFLSLLLALFMRGHLPWARVALQLALVATGAASGMAAGAYWRRGAQRTFGAWGLALAGCLFGLGLTGSPPMSLWFAVAAVLASWVLAILSKHYRWQLALIGVAGLFWALSAT